MYNKLRIHKYILGGKLIGAGGGGFFLVVTKNKKKCIRFLVKNSHNYLEFKIENLGSKIIHV